VDATGQGFSGGQTTATVGLIPAYGLARLMAFAVWGVGSGDPVTIPGFRRGCS